MYLCFWFKFSRFSFTLWPQLCQSMACRASGHWDTSREISRKAPWGELFSKGEGKALARERWWRATFLYNTIFIWRISRKVQSDLWSSCAKGQLRHFIQGAETESLGRNFLWFWRSKRCLREGCEIFSPSGRNRAEIICMVAIAYAGNVGMRGLSHTAWLCCEIYGHIKNI